MGTHLLSQDDNLPMRDSGPWVAEKLDYLERYINVFETSMRKKWPKRYYIDLFAGPGKCKCREAKMVYLGSPLLALTTKYPFTDYIFVDKDADSIATLRQRCSFSPLYNKIQFITDDANHVASTIVRSVQGPSLNLAFLDPDGLELQWNTVATLAKIEKIDLIIHYSQMGLNRAMPLAFQSGAQTDVDLFFGDTGWRTIYGKYQRREEQFLHRHLMDYYKKKLQDLGYKEALRDDEIGAEPLMRNERNAPLYRLLFASKHPLGLQFWQKVVGRNVYGQKRLL